MGTEPPQVSIVIVSWNGRELLEHCLPALSKQTFRDFETIVVDNGSEDGSARWLQEEHKDAHLVALPRNLGFAGGAYAGLAAARGRILVVLNNDMLPRPEWLSELVAGFGRHPRVGICTGKVLFHDRPDTINSAGDLLLFDGQGVGRGFNEKDAGQYERSEYVPAATGGASAYRREMLEETGFFDERYFAYFEDVDLCLRAIRRGWRCLYVPSAVALHRHMSTTRRLGEAFIISNATRNKLWNIMKDFPEALAVPALFYSLGGSLSFVLRHPRKAMAAGAAARGVLGALEGMGASWRMRIPSDMSSRRLALAMRAVWPEG